MSDQPQEAEGSAVMGRPSTYSTDIAAEICAELAGGRSLRSVCNDERMPDKATVFRWIAAHPEFRDQYARAKEESADALVEDMLSIADDGLNDTYTDEDGSERVMQDVIQRSKLRVDTRKWIASKLKPKKYGDKVQQEVSGPDGGPVQFDLAERLQRGIERTRQTS